jgi:hypothetical protein
MRQQLTTWLATAAMLAGLGVATVGTSGCVRYAKSAKKPAKACPYRRPASRRGRSSRRGRR